MTAHTSTLMPAMLSSVPNGSKRCSVVSREVGTRRPTSTIATAMIGTLTRKMEPHEKYFSSSPPLTGPSATARPLVAAHTEMAMARCLGAVNTFTNSASVAGKMSAPPTPIAARQAMSAPAESAVDASTEVSANSASPICRMPLRP
jgi:hypothetical protein